MTYADYFKKAVGFDPYPYQTALAEGARVPIPLKISTGAGKTEAAILGWLYRRFEHPNEAVRDSTSRRLVYCLPMRTLVEQTIGRVEKWFARLGMADDVGVVKLMGGEPRSQWYLHPEKPFIVVGTQDMLWHNDTFMLRSALDREALEEFFLEEYRPTPIVPP